MSDIVRVQNCISNQPYHHIYMLSRSIEGKVYAVIVPFPRDPRTDWICNCEGFHYRGYCRHIDTAPEPCRWQELRGPEIQSDEQREAHLCPRCGNDTYEELELA